MAKQVEKVLAYITRQNREESQLLVFEHQNMPEAGVQVPAGTVNLNEDVKAAVLREIEEESGLKLKTPGQFVGRFEYFRADRDEIHKRNVFHFHLSGETQNEWLHVVDGSGEDQKMVFCFYWLPLELAKTTLAVDQGVYLGEI